MTVDVASFGKCKLAWLRKFLPFENGIPSHDTFTEVFARLDSIQFYAALESCAADIALAQDFRTPASVNAIVARSAESTSR